jgi:hypothetical protein
MAQGVSPEFKTPVWPKKTQKNKITNVGEDVGSLEPYALLVWM